MRGRSRSHSRSRTGARIADRLALPSDAPGRSRRSNARPPLDRVAEPEPPPVLSRTSLTDVGRCLADTGFAHGGSGAGCVWPCRQRLPVSRRQRCPGVHERATPGRGCPRSWTARQQAGRGSHGKPPVRFSEGTGVEGGGRRVRGSTVSRSPSLSGPTRSAQAEAASGHPTPTGYWIPSRTMPSTRRGRPSRRGRGAVALGRRRRTCARAVSPRRSCPRRPGPARRCEPPRRRPRRTSRSSRGTCRRSCVRPRRRRPCRATCCAG